MCSQTSANLASQNSVKLPLRLMLIIPFALQILVAVGLTGWLSWYNGKKAVNELSGQLMTEVSTQVEQRFKDFDNTPPRADRLLTNAEMLDLIHRLKITQFAQVALISPSGTILGSSSSKDDLLSRPASPQSDPAMNKDAGLIHHSIQYLQINHPGWDKINQSERYIFQVNRQRYWLQVTPIAPAGNVDWRLLILLPESVFMTPIHANIRNTILIGIGSLGLVTVIGLIIGEAMGQSIRQLTESSQAIAQGKPRQTVVSSAVKELAILANYFTEMNQQIQQNYQDFEAYSQGLQEQLEEKTEQLDKEIRDRQIVEQQLHTSERKMRAFFEAMNDIILVLDTDGNFEIAPTNPSVLYDPDTDIIGLTIEHFFMEENFQSIQDKIQRVLETQQTFNFDYRLTVDTEEKWFAARVSPMSENSVIWVARDISDRKEAELALHIAQQQSESLLLNILPKTIAEQLKQSTDAIAEHFDAVSILFSDIVGFTPLSARLSPIDLVKLLNDMFSKFDKLAEKYQLEKIKTIGDAYMVAAGLPLKRENHAQAIAEMALDMQESIQHFSSNNGEEFQIRIGIHSGPVIAGVIGKKKFIYDLWGDTVNVASRMESSGTPGRIQISSDTYELLKDRYIVEKRGQISVKGKGEMITYWLVGRKEDKFS
jgi:PAS domain S-box-containing protein